MTDEGFRLSVLGGFRLASARRALVTLSAGSQRLLAFLALQGNDSSRARTAGTLWPDVAEDHAYASLRSALTRLDPNTRRAVVASLTELCLADGVAIDLRDSQDLAHRLLHPTRTPRPEDLSADSITSLSTELLPGWYDDWVIVEAEDWRQLRLHALEALSVRLSDKRRYGDAAASALAAVRAEPLRESGRRALIQVHLAEGNQSEAMREYDRYRRVLNAELGLEPSAHLRELVDKLLDP